MNKAKEFFANLRKSTKITLISCICFVSLTFLILCFFILFPISPSEKVMASIGRESVQKSDQNDSSITTTSNSNQFDVSKGTTVTTTAVSTNRKEYQITITTGEGFLSGGYIPSGNYSETTTSSNSEFPHFPNDEDVNNNQGTTQGSEEPTTSGNDVPIPTNPDTTEPYVEPTTEYVEPNTQEPIVTTPPDSNPVTNPNEW